MALLVLILSFLSLVARTNSQAGNWTDLVIPGSWTDIGTSYTGYIPHGDSVWHYGPARLWNTVVNSSNYVITSRVKSSVNGQGCGHVFKYKQEIYSRTQSLVQGAWGFMVGTNVLLISSSGPEYDPRFSYPLAPGQWHELRSVINGTNVKIYVGDNFATEITMSGSGADSSSGNYVGLWCHARTQLEGDNFQVEVVSSQCPALVTGPLVQVSPESCVTSPEDINTNCSFSCPHGYQINGSSFTQCGSDGEWTNNPNLVSCIDTNECADSDNAGCSHQCVNTEGSYECACPDPQLSLASDNRTCHAPGVEVHCTDDNMTITIPKSLLHGFHGDHLTLLESGCNATETSDNFALVTPLTGCGTTRRHTRTQVVYSNRVLGLNSNNGDIVSRVREIEIPFSCNYSRFGVVSSIGLETSNTKLVFNDEGTGIFTMSLNMFPNDTFVTAYTNDDFPVAVNVPEPLYFEVSVTSIDNQLSIRAMRCYSTPTQDPNHPLQYEFIRDGCSIDPTVSDYPASALSVQRFSVDSFQFVNNSQFVFMHCDVMICNASDPGSQCAISCPSTARGRRDVSKYLNTMYSLAQGPIQLVREEEEEQPTQSVVLDKSGSSPTISVALSVMYVIFLAGTALVAF